MMNIYRLGFVCSTFIAFSKVFVNSTECIDSATAATIRIVKSCPQNIKKWNEAAVRKGCEKIKHTCSSFEYHCVINAWGNETIEMCAPSLMIIGSVCTEYNHGGRRIQRNDSFQCKKCPPFYFSNESYKYQECYEYVKNANTSETTQLTTLSIDMESTTQEIVYSSSSLIPYKKSARPFQNTDTPNTPSHVIIITICVVVGLAAIAIVFTVKQRSWGDKMFAHFKRAILQSEDLNDKQSEIVIGSVEEGLEVQTILLDKRTHSCVQNEIRESSDNTSFNAISN